MKRFVQFLILALIGFGLGAGLAWFQSAQQAPVPAVEQATTGTTETGAETAAAVTEPAATDMASTETTPDTSTAAETAAPTEAVAETQPAPEAAPVAGSTVGGAFALTDHNGNAVTDASWPGEMKLVFFGFTNCPDICPTTLDKITTALNALNAEGKIQPLFITTDPARDTTDALRNYLASYHKDIIGLTGTEEQVKAVEDAYKVYASKVPGDDAEHYMMDHSAYVYLISADNKLLEIFGSSDTADSMVEKIKPHLAAAGDAAPAEEMKTPAGEPPAITENKSGDTTPEAVLGNDTAEAPTP